MPSNAKNLNQEPNMSTSQHSNDNPSYLHYQRAKKEAFDMNNPLHNHRMQGNHHALELLCTIT